MLTFVLYSQFNMTTEEIIELESNLQLLKHKINTSNQSMKLCLAVSGLLFVVGCAILPLAVILFSSSLVTLIIGFYFKCKLTYFSEVLVSVEKSDLLFFQQ